MSEEWSPYDEAGHRLNKYKHFFLREKVAKAFGDHPQEFEDWLNEHCPDNYCYAWIWNSGRKIIGDLVGVPVDLVVAIKLMTSIDPYPQERYSIRIWSTITGETNYRIEQKLIVGTRK